MPVICEFYNTAGQKIISQDSIQLVCVAKVQGTTAQMPGWGTYNYKQFDNATPSGMLYAVVSDRPIIVNPLQRIGNKLTIASAYGTVANFTVYIFDSVLNLNLAPSEHGRGVELYNQEGKVIYTTNQRHMKIADGGTILYTNMSFNVPAGYALCIPQYPTEARYTGNPNGPEGARVYWEKTGYSYNKSNGACTGTKITEFVSNESVYPAAPVNNPTQIPWAVIDVSSIDKYMATITS